MSRTTKSLCVFLMFRKRGEKTTSAIVSIPRSRFRSTSSYRHSQKCYVRILNLDFDFARCEANRFALQLQLLLRIAGCTRTETLIRFSPFLELAFTRYAQTGCIANTWAPISIFMAASLRSWFEMCYLAAWRPTQIQSSRNSLQSIRGLAFGVGVYF